ncbi:MAG: hypothetical protein NVSMB62_07550 [Acidobacteriaceae bacterium]
MPIQTLPFTIGRGPERSLSLPDPQLSRAHACIERDASGFLLRDTDSRHGTFLNGTRISTARLHSSDAIRFGVSQVTLVFEDTEETPTRNLRHSFSTTEGLPGQNDLEKLALFLKAVQSLSGLGVIKDVLCTMLEFTIRLTGAERGFVFLGDSADTLRLECGQPESDALNLLHPVISQSVVRDAVNSQSDFIISDLTDEIAQGRESLILNSIRSVVAIPLRSEGSSRLLGLLYLDSHSPKQDFNRIGKDILHAIARQAATLIENVRLLQMERDDSLLRRELEIAASIQQQIIPRVLPELPFARLSARTIPCTGVGGDFYDVIQTVDGFVAIVADVCGKGVPAALLASIVQGIFHGQVHTQTGPCASLTAIVQSLNAFLCSRAPQEKYVTLAVLRYTKLSSEAAHVDLVNGGHVAPLVIRADGRIETIEDGDLPVGLLESARFHSVRVDMEVGDRIVLLSDGITEAEDKTGAQFGTNQLERYLGNPDIVTDLFAGIEEFCGGQHPQDDQTVLSIVRTA